MKSHVVLAAFAALIGIGVVPSLGAQEGPAKRLSSIVGVAVEEYGKGIDADGRLTSQDEYDEAVSFLKDAKEVAARLSGARASATQSALDSLIAAVTARRPPRDLGPLRQRFNAALGSEGALDLPSKAIDLAEG